MYPLYSSVTVMDLYLNQDVMGNVSPAERRRNVTTQWTKLHWIMLGNMLCFRQDGITMVITTSNPTRYSTQHSYLPWVHPNQRHGRTLHARLMRTWFKVMLLNQSKENLQKTCMTIGIQLLLSIFSHHLKNLRSKRLMLLRTDIYFEHILVPYKEFWS